MSSELNEIMLGFALSEREQKVFRRLLEGGPQAASALALRLEMARNTVRGTLDSLVRKGLVLITRRANTQIYSSERKEGLIKLLQQRRELLDEEISQQIKLLELHGSVLEPSTSAAKRPRITFYDGFVGLKKVYEDTLSAKGSLRAWASFDANQEALPRYFPNYYKRRKRKGIKMRSIHPDTPLAIEGTRNNRQFLRRSVLVPQSLFSIVPEIQVYDNKLNIVSWREKLGIIIESQEIANAVTAIFDLCYNLASRDYDERK